MATLLLNRQRPAPPAVTDDEVSAGLADFALEQEEGAWVGRTTDPQWSPSVVRDDETSAGLKFFTLEQEEPWVAQTTAIPWTPVAFLDNDELGSVPKGGGGGAQFLTTFRSGKPAQFRETIDETGAGLKSFGLEQEEGAWVGATTRVDWRLDPAARDDEALPVAPPVVVDEDLPPATFSAPWLALPFADDHDLLCFRALSEDFFLLSIWDSLADLTRPPGAFADDEAGAGLGALGLEQEEGAFVPRLTQAPWNPLAFRDDEVRGTPPAFGLAESEAFEVRLTAAPWRAEPRAEDETGAGLLAFGLDQEEGAWVAQVTRAEWLRPAWWPDEAFSFSLPTPSAARIWLADAAGRIWLAEAAGRAWVAQP